MAEYPANSARMFVAELVSTLIRDADEHVVRAGLVQAVRCVRLDGALAFGLTADSPRFTSTVGVTVPLF